jgi:hypothetical protein
MGLVLLPRRFLEGSLVDEDERFLELPSHAAPRAERCLSLGVQLASVSESFISVLLLIANFANAQPVDTL